MLTEASSGGIAAMRKLRGLAASSSDAPDRFRPRKTVPGLRHHSRANTNGLDFTDPTSPLQIEDDGFRVGKIVAGPRIGVSKAAERPLRFYLADSVFVSGKR